jgi:SAM-dependent methyltransferase
MKLNIQEKYKKQLLKILRKPTQEQRRKLLTLLYRKFKVNKDAYCLDLGGISEGFEELSEKCNAVAVNLELRKKVPGWAIVIADARWLPIRPKSVDVVYSIALLEHVNSGREQVVKEINRISKIGYLIAVPYLFSPFEPHYLVPLFQFVPEFVKRIAIIRLGLKIGHIHRGNFAEIKLFRQLDLSRLFPNSEISKLTVYSLPVSLTAVSELKLSGK